MAHDLQLNPQMDHSYHPPCHRYASQLTAYHLPAVQTLQLMAFKLYSVLWRYHQKDRHPVVCVKDSSFSEELPAMQSQQDMP